jgi:hypothetical protein
MSSLQGFLEKKGNSKFGIRFKARYFVLFDRELRYFEDEKQATLKGSIELTPDTKVELGEPRASHSPAFQGRLNFLVTRTLTQRALDGVRF